MSAIQKANVTPDPPFRPTEKRVALKEKGARPLSR